MPARCWIAPEMPTAIYRVGLTVLPVWPTWSACGRQPASTTARDAPTAARPPNAAASSSSTLKFAGSFKPRPPEMTIGASATSSVPAVAGLIAVTTTRPVGAGTATVSALPALGRCTGVNTLGRSDTIAGVAVSLSLRSAFPAYTGWITVTAPPSTATSVTSCASATPRRAATRGARSRPVALAANTTARYPPAFARSAITRVHASGAYLPNASFVRVSTVSAPNPPAGRSHAPSPPRAPARPPSLPGHRQGAGRRSRLRSRPCAARPHVAPARRGLCSQHLRFFAQQAEQLQHRGRPLAHDPAFLALRRGGQGEHLQTARAEARRFDLERLLLRGHDALQGGITRLIQSLLGGEHGGEWKVHDLHAAFDFPLGRTLAPSDLEMSDRRDARQIEQLRHHRPDLMVVVVDRHLAEQDQVVARVPDLGGEGPGDLETVGGNRVRLEQDAAVRPHGQRGADRLLRGGGADRYDDDLARARLLLAPQRFFHGELVIRVEDELDARLIERFAVGGDLDAGLGVGDTLDADRDLHAGVGCQSSDPPQGAS